MWIVGAAVAGLIVVAFALVGAPHVFRGTPVARVIDADRGPAPFSLESPGFAHAAQLTSRARLEPGATVELLNNGDELFRRLWLELSAATRSITIVTYFARPGRVVDTLSGILAERARAGVAVYWVYDSVGTARIPSRYFDGLRAAGVHVQPFRPVRWYALNRANDRTHIRSVVIDGTVGYTGGFGLDDRWLGDGRTADHWRDVNARVTGPPVERLQASFIAHWAEAGHELLASELLAPRPSPASGGAARLAAGDAAQPVDPGAHSTRDRHGHTVDRAGLLISTVTIGSSTAERIIALSINAARRSLFITNAYFVPDDDFIGLLLDARRRGVDVRVLTNGPRTDVRVARLAGRHRYGELLEGGVRVYEYQPTVLHTKTLIGDGVWGLIGTINFDNRSLAFNDEVSLLVLDRGLGQRLEAEFHDDIRFATEIRLDEFRTRPRRQRVAERLADLAWRWL